MSKWFRNIAANPDDLTHVGDAISHFEELYEQYQKKLSIKGRVISEVSRELPDLAEKVHSHWKEVKAIYDFVEIRKDIALGNARRHFIEHYNRNLSASQVEKYAEIDKSVIPFLELLIEINLLQSKWEAVSKGVESLGFQVKNITLMRQGGFEEATI